MSFGPHSAPAVFQHEAQNGLIAMALMNKEAEELAKLKSYTYDDCRLQSHSLGFQSSLNVSKMLGKMVKPNTEP